MNALVACPSPESWRAYLQGTVLANHMANLALHLETCAACQATVDRLTHGTATFLEVTSRWRDASSVRSPACQRALAMCVGMIDFLCPDGVMAFQVKDEFAGRQHPGTLSPPRSEVCRMVRSTPASEGAKSPEPVLGILVDCNSFHARIPKAALAAALKKPAALPVPAAGLANGLWAKCRAQLSSLGAIRAAAVVAVLLLLLSTMAVGLHACLTSPADQDGEAAPPPDPPAAKLKTKAIAKTPAKKEAALPTVGTVITGVITASVLNTPVLAQDNAGPLGKSDWPKLEAATFTGPSKKLVKESALKDEEESSSPAEQPAGEFFGTAVTFLDSPRIAAEQALKQHKLVFVLHVSGNFEDPGFT
jgi:hypothetical protein